jgi:hypothetical protein
MTPRYESVETIIMELWEYCMELEDEYHRTADHAVLIQFAVAIVSVQHWEDVLLRMEGLDVYRFYF